MRTHVVSTALITIISLFHSAAAADPTAPTEESLEAIEATGEVAFDGSLEPADARDAARVRAIDSALADAVAQGVATIVARGDCHSKFSVEIAPSLNDAFGKTPRGSHQTLGL